MPLNTSDISIAAKINALDQITQMQHQLDYDVQDFTIDSLVQEFHAHRIYLPTFQNDWVWDNKQCTRFIESVILGLPLPVMFFAATDDYDRFEIIDGIQRIRTLDAFLANHLRLENTEILSLLDGFRFSDIHFLQQNKFKSRTIRVFVVKDSLHIRHQLVRWLNTGCMPHVMTDSHDATVH
jgi:uncharacterized protein with ParB-like and HNH nuclease domain